PEQANCVATFQDQSFEERIVRDHRNDGEMTNALCTSEVALVRLLGHAADSISKAGLSGSRNDRFLVSSASKRSLLSSPFASETVGPPSNSKRARACARALSLSESRRGGEAPRDCRAPIRPPECTCSSSRSGRRPGTTSRGAGASPLRPRPACLGRLARG